MSDTSGASNESSELQLKRKRGVRNCEKYKNNVRIKSRLLGKSYVSQKGVAKPARQTGPDCRYVVVQTFRLGLGWRLFYFFKGLINNCNI